MLKSVQLDNFKAFSNSGLIDIKPLTILCGTNSSGKSSILKSLLLLKQSFENTSATNNVTLDGPYTQNGKMGDIIYKSCGNGFTITTSSEFISPSKYGSMKGSNPYKQDIISFKELKKTLGTPYYSTVKMIMKMSIQVVYNSGMKSANNVIKQFDLNLSCYDKYNNLIKEPIKIVLDHKRTNIYNIIFSNFPGENGQLINSSISNCFCYFEGMRLVNAYATKDQTIQFDMFFPKLYSFMRHAAHSFKGISNLSPLRHMPERYYFVHEDYHTVGQDGEYTPQVIYNNIETQIISIMPPLDGSFSFEKRQQPFYNFLESWEEYLGIGKMELKGSDTVIQLSINNHSLVDIGFGVSQVLPILTKTLLLKQYQTLLIEQPEIHLHPKMQMNLADLFIASSQLDRNLIVETHSDHIVNRVLRRILEDTSGNLSKMISIYFVEKTDEGSIVVPILINPEFGFIDVPDDFFSQFSSETDAIFSACLNNKKGLSTDV